MSNNIDIVHKELRSKTIYYTNSILHNKLIKDCFHFMFNVFLSQKIIKTKKTEDILNLPKLLERKRYIYRKICALKSNSFHRKFNLNKLKKKEDFAYLNKRSKYFCNIHTNIVLKKYNGHSLGRNYKKFVNYYLKNLIVKFLFSQMNFLYDPLPLTFVRQKTKIAISVFNGIKQCDLLPIMFKYKRSKLYALQDLLYDRLKELRLTRSRKNGLRLGLESFKELKNRYLYNKQGFNLREYNRKYSLNTGISGLLKFNNYTQSSTCFFASRDVYKSSLRFLKISEINRSIYFGKFIKINSKNLIKINFKSLRNANSKKRKKFKKLW